MAEPIETFKKKIEDSRRQYEESSLKAQQALDDIHKYTKALHVLEKDASIPLTEVIAPPKLVPDPESGRDDLPPHLAFVNLEPIAAIRSLLKTYGQMRAKKIIAMALAGGNVLGDKRGVYNIENSLQNNIVNGNLMIVGEKYSRDIKSVKAALESDPIIMESPPGDKNSSHPKTSKKSFLSRKKSK